MITFKDTIRLFRELPAKSSNRKRSRPALNQRTISQVRLPKSQRYGESLSFRLNSNSLIHNNLIDYPCVCGHSRGPSPGELDSSFELIPRDDQAQNCGTRLMPQRSSGCRGGKSNLIDKPRGRSALQRTCVSAAVCRGSSPNAHRRHPAGACRLNQCAYRLGKRVCLTSASADKNPSSLCVQESTHTLGTARTELESIPCGIAGIRATRILNHPPFSDMRPGGNSPRLEFRRNRAHSNYDAPRYSNMGDLNHPPQPTTGPSGFSDVNPYRVVTTCSYPAASCCRMELMAGMVGSGGLSNRKAAANVLSNPLVARRDVAAPCVFDNSKRGLV